MKRRALLTAGAIVVAAGLTGCTAMLFEDGRYEETVDRFLVSEDGKKFVVLGEKYHYIFDMPEHLGAVLASPYRKSINASLYGFVAQGSKISGKFRLQLRRADMTDEGWDRAQEDGFANRGSSDLEMKGELAGSRYLADGFCTGQDVVVVCAFVQDRRHRPHHHGGQGRARARDPRHARGRRRDDDRGGGVVACHRGVARAGRGRRARAVTRSARHASVPVAAAPSPNGELPHRSLRGRRSQSGRLTVLPRPGQLFPRSLVQERGLFARPTPQGRVGGTGQAFGGQRNRTGCVSLHPIA
ncbi:transmembrane protein, putative, partial [Medicago truncatula]